MALAFNSSHKLSTITDLNGNAVTIVYHSSGNGNGHSPLFQVISRRYDRDLATVLTSNKSFTDWGQVFGGDPVLASVALDRLLHRCTVVNIRGDSYRLKERRKAGKEVLPL